MILFEEDFSRYPTASIQTTTSNKSFMDICYILDDMGVRNHLWPLALINPDLKYVNPHDWEYLTLEEKGMITQECFENPWYYFREVGRVPVEGSLVPSPIRATRGHMALWWCYFNHITTFLIMPRQCGKSVGMASLDRYLLNFGMVRSSIHLLTKEDSLRRNDIKRIKEFEEVLPPYLQRGNKKTDPNNQENIMISANGNSYWTHVPRADEKSAYKVGRGFTSANVRIDEFAYITWLKASLTTILSTTNAAFKSARENHSHHGIIMSTTAGKKDDRDGSYAYDILTRAFPFTDNIYDCQDWDDLKRTIEATSTNGFAINCTFGHRQVGLTDEEHYFNVKKAMITKEEADRDYFNVWTSGSIGSPLTPDQLGTIRASQRDKFWTEIDPNPNTRYMTKWYVAPDVREKIMAEGNIVLGADTSDASGKDEIALQYLDLNTLELIGSSFINMTNLAEFSMYLYNRLMQYPKLTLIIERKSSGPAILDHLLKMFQANGQNAFRRIFNRIVQEADKYKDIYDEIRVGSKYVWASHYTAQKATFGFSTSATGEYSRSILYNQVLQNAVRHSMDRINDVKTIDQIMALEVKNDRVDHPKGGHDDGVIAWLLPQWLAMFGENLHFYGIDTAAMMSNTLISRQNKIETKMEQEQMVLRQQMEAILETMAKTRDPILTHRLTAQLRTLTAKIVQQDNEVFSVTDMLKKFKEDQRFGQNQGNKNSFGSSGLFASVADKMEIL